MMEKEREMDRWMDERDDVGGWVVERRTILSSSFSSCMASRQARVRRQSVWREKAFMRVPKATSVGRRRALPTISSKKTAMAPSVSLASE